MFDIENYFPLLIVALGVIVLLILIMKLNLNTFISLIIVSFLVALALGMPLDEIVSSIEGGMGGTLGSIALIFGFGAILGKLISDAGGAQRIAIDRCFRCYRITYFDYEIKFKYLHLPDHCFFFSCFSFRDAAG